MVKVNFRGLAPNMLGLRFRGVQTGGVREPEPELVREAGLGVKFGSALRWRGKGLAFNVAVQAEDLVFADGAIYFVVLRLALRDS